MRRRAKAAVLGLLALGLAGLAWALFVMNFGSAARRPSQPASALEAIDTRESGGTWAVRGVLQEEERLRLLQNGIRCYQFDSRSW